MKFFLKIVTPIAVFLIGFSAFSHENQEKKLPKKQNDPSRIKPAQKSDNTKKQTLEQRIKRLEQKLEAVEEVQEGDSEDQEESNLEWGAYGEVKYIDQQSVYKKDQTNLHRLVLLGKYDFNEELYFVTEIEYEYAGYQDKEVGDTTIQDAAVYAEQMYINYSFSESFQIQGGLNLVPVGITNLVHEPTTFLGVERPRTEREIIPATWREIGVIVHGKLFDSLIYRIGVMNGPRARDFNDSSWIRGGRTKGSKARAENYAALVNVDYSPIDGFMVGASYYRGDSGQGEVNDAGWKTRLSDPIDVWADDSGLRDAYQEIRDNRNSSGTVRVHLAEAHMSLNYGPWMGRAVFARGWMNERDTRNVNSTTGKNIGKVVEGAYAELGYNVLSFFSTPRKLYPFIRLEYVNTQKQTVERQLGGQEDIMDAVCTALNNTCMTTASLANGNRDLGVIQASDSAREAYGIRGVPNRVNDKRIATFGLAFYPVDSVVIKAEYERQSSKTRYSDDIESRNPNNNKIDRFQVAIGFSF